MKYHELVPCLQNKFEKLSDIASVDVHNHFLNGTTGLEDAWQTKNAHLNKLLGSLDYYLQRHI